MFIQVTTRVSFHLPDDESYMDEFISANDMNMWKKYEDTIYTTFVNTEERYLTERREDD